MKNITSKEEHIRWLDEEERWSPINPYLDIEDCYEVSSYGRIRNTRYNKILDDIHHSTNGFDYIFIATKEHKPSYQHIDLIVCMTFWAWNVNNLPVHEPIIPSHIDGDTRNNRASNLEFVIDKEIWKPIVGYKDIIDGMYEISNHGNVRNVVNKFKCQITFNPSHYPCCGFRTSNGSFSYFVHRIIAQLFIQGHDKTHNMVNHIDNMRINNHWRNLEWCDCAWNNEHGFSYRFRTEVDLIRMALFNNNGSETDTRDELLELGHDFSIRSIRSVKALNVSNRSFMYTQEEIRKLPLLIDDKLKRLEEWEIRKICELLVKNNFNISLTQKELLKFKIKISDQGLRKIRAKRRHIDISKEYF